MTFILGKKPMHCFICKAVEEGVSKENLVLYVTEHSMVMLNRYPYISGHLMVVPHAHVSGLDNLSEEQMVDLHETLRKTISAVRTALAPQGINVGMNLGKAAGAGVEDHIHWHVIPRFLGDNNAFNVLAEARVIPESLEATFERYLPVFRELQAAAYSSNTASE
jgi:ATP adenylyltransferase